MQKYRRELGNLMKPAQKWIPDFLRGSIQKRFLNVLKAEGRPIRKQYPQLLLDYFREEDF
jgi:hypothetical protein